MSEKWILIVDDESSIFPVLNICLKKLGGEFIAVTVPNELEALQRLAEQNFDFVVASYKTGNLDETAFLEKVHSIRPQAQVIWIATYSSSSIEAESNTLRVYRYLVKHFKIAALPGPTVKPASQTLALSKKPTFHRCDCLEAGKILSQIHKTVHARCAFLVDSTGKYLAYTGSLKNLSTAKIALLLGKNITALRDHEENIGSVQNALNLSGQVKEYDHISIIRTDPRFLLLVIFSPNSVHDRLQIAWYSIKTAVIFLLQKLSGKESSLSGTFTDVEKREASYRGGQAIPPSFSHRTSHPMPVKNALSPRKTIEREETQRKT